MQQYKTSSQSPLALHKAGKRDSAKTEANYKQYYQWYLGNNPNIEALLHMAQQCPQTNGSIVYNARAWYNSLTGQSIMFSNNCKDANKAIDNKNFVANKVLEFYPNPANNFIVIKNNNYKQVIIYNSYGKEVYNNTVNNSSDIKVALQLSNGIYFIKGVTTSNEFFTNKLLLNK